MNEKAESVRPGESIPTDLRDRTDSMVSPAESKKVLPVVDAEQEALEKVNQEIRDLFKQMNKIKARYDEEMAPLDAQLDKLLRQRKLLGPKPACYGKFTEQVDRDSTPCEECIFGAQCYLLDRARLGDIRDRSGGDR